MSRVGNQLEDLLLPGAVPSSPSRALEDKRTPDSSPASTPSPPMNPSKVFVDFPGQKNPKLSPFSSLEAFLNKYHPSSRDNWILDQKEEERIHWYKHRAHFVCAADLVEVLIELVIKYCPLHYHVLLRHPLTHAEFVEENIQLIKIIVIALLQGDFELEKFSDELWACGIAKKSIAALKKKLSNFKDQSKSDPKTKPLDLIIQDAITLIQKICEFSQKPNIEELHIASFFAKEAVNYKRAMCELERIINYFSVAYGFICEPDIWKCCNEDKKIFFRIRHCYQIQRVWNIFDFLTIDQIFALATMLKPVNDVASLLDIFSAENNHKFILNLLGGDDDKDEKLTSEIIIIKDVLFASGKFELLMNRPVEDGDKDKQSTVFVPTGYKLADLQKAIYIRLCAWMAFKDIVIIRFNDKNSSVFPLRLLLLCADIKDMIHPPIAHVSPVCYEGDDYEQNYMRPTFSDICNVQSINDEHFGISYRFTYGEDNKLVGFAYFELGVQLIKLNGTRYFDSRNILLSIISASNKAYNNQCQGLLQKLNIFFSSKGFHQIILRIETDLILKKHTVYLTCQKDRKAKISNFFRLINVSEENWHIAEKSPTEIVGWRNSPPILEKIIANLQHLDNQVETQLISMQSINEGKPSEDKPIDILPDDDTSLLILAIIYEQKELFSSLLKKIYDCESFFEKLIEDELFDILNKMISFLSPSEKDLAQKVIIEKMRKCIDEKNLTRIIILLKILLANDLYIAARALALLIYKLTIEKGYNLRKDLQEYYPGIAKKLKSEFNKALEKRNYSSALNTLLSIVSNRFMPVEDEAKLITDFLSSDHKQVLSNDRMNAFLCELIMAIYELSNSKEKKSKDSLDLKRLIALVVKQLNIYKTVYLTVQNDKDGNFPIHYVLLCDPMDLVLFRAVLAHTKPAYLETPNKAFETPLLLGDRKTRLEKNQSIVDEIVKRIPRLAQSEKSSPIHVREKLDVIVEDAAAEDAEAKSVRPPRFAFLVPRL